MRNWTAVALRRGGRRCALRRHALRGTMLSGAAARNRTWPSQINPRFAASAAASRWETSLSLQLISSGEVLRLHAYRSASEERERNGRACPKRGQSPCDEHIEIMFDFAGLTRCQNVPFGFMNRRAKTRRYSTWRPIPYQKVSSRLRGRARHGLTSLPVAQSCF